MSSDLPTSATARIAAVRLLFLVPVFSQTFLAFVGGDLVALSFFTAGHNAWQFKGL